MTAPAVRAPGAIGLAVGIVALEFAAALGSFVAATLLPVIAGDLHAGNRLGLLVAGTTLGVFVALPLAGRVVRRLGARRTLAAGTVLYTGGPALAATAHAAVVFAAGQFLGGLAGGLLAVFGVGAAIEHLDEALRLRVVAASSAMWIVPALVGPAATLGLDRLLGWRWTLLVPVPVVLAGRFLVVRAARRDRPANGGDRPAARTLLVPLGVAGVVFSGGCWPGAVAGAVVALAGAVTIMPAGTFRARPGTPAALAAMTLFAGGYFGADSLITVLLTDADHTSLAGAAVVLGAAPLAWAVTSLAVSGVASGVRHGPVIGLATAAFGVIVLAVSRSFVLALAGWAVAGIGVGLAYPGLYILCTRKDSGAATELATAVVTAEAFGGLLGRAAVGAIGSSGTTGLLVAYLSCGGVIAVGAVAAHRVSRA